MMDELKPCPSSPTQANEASIALLEIMEDGVASQQKALSTAYKALYWIANDRRTAPENEPLTLDELLSMDGEPVWSYWASWVIVNVVSKSNVEFVYRDGSKNDYEELVELGMTPVLYKQIPEGSPKCKTNAKGTKINSAACKVLQAWAKSLEYSEPEESEN